MTNKFAGTQTEKNLWAAFAGESQARNKYDYFAGVARKEGYQQIAELFMETAMNERQHAKIWFKHLEGIGDTAANLKAAAEGEKRKASPNSPSSSAPWAPLKRPTKNATSSFSTTSK